MTDLTGTQDGRDFAHALELMFDSTGSGYLGNKRQDGTNPPLDNPLFQEPDGRPPGGHATYLVYGDEFCDCP